MKWKVFIVTVLVMLTVSVSGGTAFAAGPGSHPALPDPALACKAIEANAPSNAPFPAALPFACEPIGE